MCRDALVNGELGLGADTPVRTLHVLTHRHTQWPLQSPSQSRELWHREVKTRACHRLISHRDGFEPRQPGPWGTSTWASSKRGLVRTTLGAGLPRLHYSTKESCMQRTQKVSTYPRHTGLWEVQRGAPLLQPRRPAWLGTKADSGVSLVLERLTAGTGSPQGVRPSWKR